MMKPIVRLFTENLFLKVFALILALIIWFYVGKELDRESEGGRQYMRKLFPSEGVIAKKLAIRPLFVGTPHSGYRVATDNVAMTSGYTIVVGTKDLLEKIQFISTMPIDVEGATRPFTRSVSLRPIPGVYMEDTSTEVTVQVEKVERTQ